MAPLGCDISCWKGYTAAYYHNFTNSRRTSLIHVPSFPLYPIHIIPAMNPICIQSKWSSYIHRLVLDKLVCPWVARAALASASAAAILRLSAGIKDEDAWLSANSLTDAIFREPSPVEDAIKRNTIMYSLLYSCPVIDWPLADA